MFHDQTSETEIFCVLNEHFTSNLLDVWMTFDFKTTKLIDGKFEDFDRQTVYVGGLIPPKRTAVTFFWQTQTNVDWDINEIR